MSLVSLPVPRHGASLDAFALAARLERGGARAVSVLASQRPNSEHGRHSFVAAEPAAWVRAVDPFEGAAAPAPGDPLGFAPRFLGVLPYEAARARLERASWTQPDRRGPALAGEAGWWRYDAVIAIDERSGEAQVIGLPEAAAGLLARLRDDAPSSGTFADFTFTSREVEPGALHASRVAALIERIHAGELYQANIARQLAVELTPADAARAIALGRSLAQAFPTAFGVVLELPGGERVIGSSPELLLDASADPTGARFDRLVSDPIKGTRARGANPAEDAARQAELESDPKERAELAMIVDVVRNDLSRVCRVGSVLVERAPHVVSHSTVHHRLARVVGRARPELSREEVLASVWPSGSVTGAPKVRAMELVAELEPMRRGLYTGGFGYAAWDGSMRLAMAIRTLVLGPDGRGEYLVGGGIVADSDPETELRETAWKSTQLARLTDPRYPTL